MPTESFLSQCLQNNLELRTLRPVPAVVARVVPEGLVGRSPDTDHSQRLATSATPTTTATAKADLQTVPGHSADHGPHR